MEEQELIVIHSKLSVLDERSKNFEARLDGIEKEIDDKLRTIENKIDKQRSETNTKLDSIGGKLDEVLVSDEKRKASIKTLGMVGGLVIVLAGFLSWLVDKWELIKNTFF